MNENEKPMDFEAGDTRLMRLGRMDDNGNLTDKSEDKTLKTNAEIMAEKAPAISERDKILQNLLDKQPALMEKLMAALETGRYFITVTMQKKDSPDDKNDLKHFYTRCGLSANDVTGSLRHLLKDYNSKENPNAMVEEPGGGLY